MKVSSIESFKYLLLYFAHSIRTVWFFFTSSVFWKVLNYLTFYSENNNQHLISGLISLVGSQYMKSMALFFVIGFPFFHRLWLDFLYHRGWRPIWRGCTNLWQIVNSRDATDKISTKSSCSRCAFFTVFYLRERNFWILVGTSCTVSMTRTLRWLISSTLFPFFCR